MFRKSVDVSQKDQVSPALDTPEVRYVKGEARWPAPPPVRDVGVTMSDVEAIPSDVGLSRDRVSLTASGVGMSVTACWGGRGGRRSERESCTSGAWVAVGLTESRVEVGASRVGVG
jgi:hypothetical protein